VEKFQKYLVVIRYADIGSKVPVEKISGNQLTCGIETIFQIGTLNARSVIIPNISRPMLWLTRIIALSRHPSTSGLTDNIRSDIILPAQCFGLDALSNR